MRICSARVLLIVWIIAAKVVVFPEPVGPVTRTSPRGFSLSSRTIGGKFRSSMSGILEESARKQAA